MNKFAAGLPALFFLLLCGCATSAPQTEAVLKNRQHLPEAVFVSGVKFQKQTENYCGPATLSLAMQYAGENASMEELASQVYSPKQNGTLQQNMISASRRHGLLAVPINGLPALLQELAAGHPVIVFENLAFNWFPQWHYALALGYDLKNENIILNSGAEENKKWNLKKFERSWNYSDSWGLVVLPAGQLSASATELAHAAAAAGLEQIGKSNEANLVYKNILSRWPDSLPALIGLANLAFEQKDYSRAEVFLKQAVLSHPESAAAKNNLKVVRTYLQL